MEMLIVKSWLKQKGLTSLILGVVYEGMIFSFKKPKEKPVELVFHQKPISILEAIQSLKTRPDKLFHYFEHQERDLPGNLHVGGKLCFNIQSKECVDLIVAYYFGEGTGSFHEFSVTVKLSELDIFVETINKFFVKK